MGDSALRSLKTAGMKLRPIHRLAGRVRSRILLRMRAFSTEWPMSEARCVLMFTDTDRHDPFDTAPSVVCCQMLCAAQPRFSF